MLSAHTDSDFSGIGNHKVSQLFGLVVLDNAAAETFFKTSKAEQIWRRTWQTRRSVEMVGFEYINGFYNPRSRHSALGCNSPDAFERKVA